MPQPSIPTHRQLAEHFAPIVAQKVFNEWPAGDQIAPVDFAGSMAKVADNPAVLDAKPENYVIPNPKVYYSICETTTHYFLIYAVYHVFDWWRKEKATSLYDLIRDSLDEHLHDMEGALVVVSKEPDGPKPNSAELSTVPHGLIEAVVTIAHNNFYLYTGPLQKRARGKPAPPNFPRKSLDVVKFNESIDGNIWIDRATGRFKLYVEGRGHGIRGDKKHWGGGDQVWYYRPTGELGDPSSFNEDDKTKVLDYELEDMFAPRGLWEHRFHHRVFKQNAGGKWAFVHRKKMTSGGIEPGAANPPWSWNDHNDTSPIGEIATDPARFMIRYAQGWGPVSTQYLSNTYLGI